jgi:CO dehydrogenase/acetyl-CoA synthase beta subunit
VDKFLFFLVQISGSKDQRNVLADTDEDDEDNDHLKDDDHKIVEEEVKSLDQVQAVASRFSQEEEEEEEDEERNDRADEEEEEERNIQVVDSVHSVLYCTVYKSVANSLQSF